MISAFIIVLLIISVYLIFIFRVIKYPIINFYLAINCIIFYLPALLFVLFGVTHPSQFYSITNKFNYLDIFFYVLLLIFIFDFTLYFSYLIGSKIKISSKIFFFNNFGISNEDFFYNCKSFVIYLGLLIIISDTYLILSLNAFMNKELILCNEDLPKIFKIFVNNENFSYINSFNQVFKSISLLKYMLLALLTKALDFNFNKTIKLLFYIVLIYCLLFGLISGSRFQIIFPIIIIIFINFKKILSLKGIILAPFILYLSLYIFPLIAALRNIRNKGLEFKECNKFENVGQTILNNLDYNNIHKVSEYTSLLNFDISKNGFLYKPFETILSRMNYFDITMKSYNYKINENISNKVSFYLDNFIGLIPRALYPNKKIISNHSDQLAVDLGVNKISSNAVGLRPLAESFLYIGNYYLIVAIILGLFFGISKTFTRNNNLFTFSFFVFAGLMILKRDSFHAVIPGIFHEAFAYLIMLIVILLIKKFKT